MLYLILLYLIIKTNNNQISRTTCHMNKICQIDNYTKTCYEMNIPKVLLPFVLQYNKNIIKGCCSSYGYYIFVNTTNISTPIGNISSSIFR
jgi:hypothetical protein